MPASASVLFGYQFKSIAALGPIVGPITAAQFGWLPSILWLVVGVFFIGWVQDYASAMLAMRSEGMTMGGLSYRLISPRARGLLLSFLYIYLLLIMGAFGAIIAPLLAGKTVAIGFLLLVVAGVLAGQMTYRWRVDLMVTTVVTVLLALIGIYIGTTNFAQNIVGGINGLAGNTDGVLFTRPIGLWRHDLGCVLLGHRHVRFLLPWFRFAHLAVCTAGQLHFVLVRVPGDHRFHHRDHHCHVQRDGQYFLRDPGLRHCLPAPSRTHLADLVRDHLVRRGLRVAFVGLDLGHGTTAGERDRYAASSRWRHVHRSCLGCTLGCLRCHDRGHGRMYDPARTTA